MSIVKEEIFKGLPASKGISIGKPFIYKTEALVYEYDFGGKFSSKKEIKDYDLAIAQSKKELSKILNLAKEKLDEKHLQIFEAQFDFLEDKILHQKVYGRINKEKLPAYKVFYDEISVIENQLLASSDDYIRERVADVEDIKNRILRNLNRKKLFSKIDENRIVVARNLTPSDTILFSNRKMLGFATDLGGLNSHLAIIARSINVPAVVGIGDISLKVKSADTLILDGYKGYVICNPSKGTLKDYKEQVRKNNALEKRLLVLEKLPTQTKDNRKITLTVNLEFNKELDYILTHAGCGVGLYRTEHMFLEKGDFPSEEEQYKQYRMIADKLYPNTVTLRTFDIGGDKLLPDSQREANPFLGWRGIRICLDKKDIFLDQLKAMLRASRRGNVKIMFPLIASLDELLEAKHLLKEAMKNLDGKRQPYDKYIRAGIMVEVPSAVFIGDELAKESDFFSIGTNDLVQYLLAVDRSSSIVSDLYQKFHPAVISALKLIVEISSKHGIGLSVCGEMAGDPVGAILLIGLGVTELSVETTSFLKTKKLIRSVNYSDAKAAAEKVLTFKHEKEIREYLIKSFKKILTTE